MKSTLSQTIGQLTINVETSELEKALAIIKQYEQSLQEANALLDDFISKRAKAESYETFYTVEDVMEKTGYSKPTVLNIFNSPDFPCENRGKKQIVSARAFWKYYDERHKA